MEERNYVVEMDVQIMLGRECGRHGGQKLCRYEGCTKQDQGGGVCRSHGAKHKNDTARNDI